MDRHLSLVVPDPLYERLNYVVEVTGLTRSELMRRMFGFCTQGWAINQIVPEMSGRILGDNLKVGSK